MRPPTTSLPKPATCRTSTFRTRKQSSTRQATIFVTTRKNMKISRPLSTKPETSIERAAYRNRINSKLSNKSNKCGNCYKRQSLIMWRGRFESWCSERAMSQRVSKTTCRMPNVTRRPWWRYRAYWTRAGLRTLWSISRTDRA
jgi:hypothetical protein